MGTEISRHSLARESARLHAAALSAAAPRRLALRQGQCRMDRGQVQRVGLGRAHRELRGAVPDAQGARLVEMAEPTHFVAKLRSRPLAGRSHLEPAEPSSCRPTTPTRSTATSTAPLVYVNYGVPADYEQLERMGISVKGAIVIARYGESWRGIKPKVAAEHGAVGCLDLFGSARRRLCRGRCFPRRARGGRRTACSAEA